MEVIHIEVRHSKADILKFITRLTRFLTSEDFDINRDIFFIRKKSNTQTLSELEYSTEDVVDHLKTLRIEEFSEVFFDFDNADPPYLYVFGRTIEKRLVYIKIKVREKGDNKTVVCISFHFADRPMHFPYK